MLRSNICLETNYEKNKNQKKNAKSLLSDDEIALKQRCFRRSSKDAKDT